MLRPRQSIATPSLGNVTTALQASPSPPQYSRNEHLQQTSDVTFATSSVSATVSVGPTTTSSSTDATSTSQTTSEQTTSTAPSTSSRAPTSSFSSPSSSTTSSTPSTSSSVPPSSTTQPPIPSSGTPTTITSAYTTYVNGSAVLTQTAVPSTIPEPSSTSSSERTAIIAGAAAGGTALLILLLSLAFCARRKQFKRLDFLRTLMLKRKQERSRATMLDGEVLDDIDLARSPLGYTDYDTPWDPRVLLTPGSAYVPHEGTRLMDPLANRDDLDLDLGHIVDDVMGRSSTAAHFSDRSVSSVYRDSVAESDGVVHSRTVSNASNTVLLEAAGLGGPSTAPVRSSPLAQSGTHPGGNVS